ncbi:hypothetical protein HUT16_35060 [Kitasatospora sp. NA04385]|uniref:hypothetical protein n=1 Tax=Kitasatospora sp. NA04385 TaxID=2742135 RepID=UPI00158FADFE|nr:hypothetical protein [Kitasatospora sp. NA04385]QKW23626.1 hypothetical protein HUT16_35060 [Kitasatospora sp. NA04385]
MPESAVDPSVADPSVADPSVADASVADPVDTVTEVPVAVLGAGPPASATAGRRGGHPRGPRLPGRAVHRPADRRLKPRPKTPQELP